MGKAAILTRADVRRLEDIPNIGKSMAGDLRSLGIEKPTDLVGRDAYVLHRALCDKTHVEHDPCVIDAFLSAIRFMEGGPKKSWWEFTAERKATLARRRNS